MKMPWESYLTPVKMFGNLYFIGTYDASTHLIDTGEGLILIDPGYQESVYLVVNNIWELGFKPTDIKYILISHGHIDHFGGTRELASLSGAKTFIGREDLNAVSEFFTPDYLIDDGDEIKLGNTVIKCVHTPGHTDGTISFFFDVSDGKNVFRAGMHGGAGTNTLTKKYLIENNLPLSNRQKFLDGIEKVRKEKVDIFVGNHAWNNHTDIKIPKLLAGEKNVFIDESEWEKYLNERKGRMMQVIEEEKERI